MTPMFEQALRRPLDHHLSPPAIQWENDKRLGLLDWNPTREESDEYIRRRAEMGDPTCQFWCDKLELSKGAE